MNETQIPKTELEARIARLEQHAAASEERDTAHQRETARMQEQIRRLEQMLENEIRQSR